MTLRSTNSSEKTQLRPLGRISGLRQSSGFIHASIARSGSLKCQAKVRTGSSMQRNSVPDSSKQQESQHITDLVFENAQKPHKFTYDKPKIFLTNDACRLVRHSDKRQTNEILSFSKILNHLSFSIHSRIILPLLNK